MNYFNIKNKIKIPDAFLKVSLTDVSGFQDYLGFDIEETNKFFQKFY